MNSVTVASQTDRIGERLPGCNRECGKNRGVSLMPTGRKRGGGCASDSTSKDFFRPILLTQILNSLTWLTDAARRLGAARDWGSQCLIAFRPYCPGIRTGPKL